MDAILKSDQPRYFSNSAGGSAGVKDGVWLTLSPTSSSTDPLGREAYAAALRPFIAQAREAVAQGKPFISTTPLPAALIAHLMEEVQRLQPGAEKQDRLRTTTSLQLAEGEGTLVPHVLHILPADKIPASSPLTVMGDAVRDWMAEIYSPTPIYAPGDSKSGVNINIMNRGDQLGPHFDGVSFVTVILLKPATLGGRLFYREGMVTDETSVSDREKISKRIIESNDFRIVDQNLPGGIIMTMRGCDVLHGVTPIENNGQRVVLVVSAYDNPKGSFADHIEAFYGNAKL